MSQKIKSEPTMSPDLLKNPQGEEVPVNPGGENELDAASQDSPITRNTIIQRAQKWADQHVPYSQSALKDGYCTDCSGYVSMAWDLSSSRTTWTFPEVSRQISKESLQPGDVLITNNPADLTQPSTADMLAKLRRVLIAARFRPSRPDQITPAEIHILRLAWDTHAA